MTNPDFTLHTEPNTETLSQSALASLVLTPIELASSTEDRSAELDVITPDVKPDLGPRAAYRIAMSDIPEGERPRERFVQAGASAMSARELLAILLRTGSRGLGVLALADELLRRFGNLAGLARADLNELQQVHGMGPVKAIELKTALELGKRMVFTNPDQRPLVKTPADAAQLLMGDMGLLEQEEVRILMLDTRNRLLGSPMIYRGTLNAANMRVAEVFRDAIRANSASIIVAHNHPSGDPSPSADDVTVTRELIKAGKLLDIEVLDHLVMAHSRFVSLKERGLAFE